MLSGGRKTLIACIAYALGTITFLCIVFKTGQIGDSFKLYLNFVEWVTVTVVMGIGIEHVANIFQAPTATEEKPVADPNKPA